MTVSRDELNALADQLRSRLPEHTFKAVVRRAKLAATDEQRRSILESVLVERERSEATA